MTRSVRRVFDEHVAAVRDRDLDAIVAGYAADAVLADSDRIGRGHDYIRAVHAATLDAAAGLDPAMEVFELGEVVFVSWRATRDDGPDLVGTNTFVVVDGVITVNTAFMSPSSLAPIRLDHGLAATEV
ncbi:nuclear transport factor 2 family protein [Actinomycetospora endophytica]|uniref:Nuclear transport factor 2 family protein n=1 Tax=Actinomycetospora endophytica TaxID=2291215 RepID=A0ABS8P139_9PSEU|nr:nuclear transport factor 2 family protein [Actinomycetospora endophytica]MCD2191958.1 nuclear transport factor 2 family protein [Actinomycetospora endophytica]